MYASGSKAHLGQLLNKEKMLNIKDAQLSMASFSIVIILPAGCSPSSVNAQARTFSKKLKSQNPLQKFKDMFGIHAMCSMPSPAPAASMVQALARDGVG